MNVFWAEDTFERKHEYGTVLQVTKDSKLKDYLGNVLGQVWTLFGAKQEKTQNATQVESWAAQGALQQLVMVIAKVRQGKHFSAGISPTHGARQIDTGEPLERWVFHVETDKRALSGGEFQEKPREQMRGAFLWYSIRTAHSTGRRNWRHHAPDHFQRFLLATAGGPMLL